MHRLTLKAGDRVRNINPRSRRKGMEGVVSNIMTFDVMVTYNNGQTQTYGKGLAHNYLELIEDKPTMEQRLSRLEAMAATTAVIVDFDDLDISKALERAKMKTTTFGYMYGSPKRQVLKKVRRNVISGKTQDEMVKELGQARGVTEFNTRCTGRTTAQALSLLGAAMRCPGSTFDLKGIDHILCEGAAVKLSDINDHFVHTMCDIADKLHLKGLTIRDYKVTYNPIVTEETYVEL